MQHAQAGDQEKSQRQDLKSSLSSRGEAPGGKEEGDAKARADEKDREEASKALIAARQAILGGEYDLVVLDEVNVAVAWKLIGLDEVIRLIEGRPSNVELVLTGRGADKEIVKMADVVTEMLNIKHPYNEGITARRGIEY